MPFLFIIIGLVMVTAAVRNTVSDTKDANGTPTAPGLSHLLINDFTGKNNFVYWVLSILIIGALGYIKPLQPVSRAFLFLVIIVLFLSNKGVFAKFNAALAGTQAVPEQNTPIPLINLGGQWSGGSNTELPTYNMQQTIQ